MSAPAGNRFWELRSTHGRAKLFETPELMWQAACEYFEWCEENPFQKSELKVVSNGGKEGSSMEVGEVPVMRPFTLHGLCSYLDCNTAYFRTFKSQERGKNEDFSTVINKIEETIYNQKFSGAASGFLNANIIARDLGLIEKAQVDQNNTGETVIRIIRDGDNGSTGSSKETPSGTEVHS